jgi:hypothetical protein
MKKHQKKLTLHRETLQRLETGSLWRVRGRADQLDSGCDTCGMCDSNLSCTGVEEDCCVGTNLA